MKNENQHHLTPKQYPCHKTEYLLVVLLCPEHAENMSRFLSNQNHGVGITLAFSPPVPTYLTFQGVSQTNGPPLHSQLFTIPFHFVGTKTNSSEIMLQKACLLHLPMLFSQCSLVLKNKYINEHIN